MLIQDVFSLCLESMLCNLFPYMDEDSKYHKQMSYYYFFPTHVLVYFPVLMSPFESYVAKDYVFAGLSFWVHVQLNIF